MATTTLGLQKLLAWCERRGLEPHDAAHELGLREHNIRRYLAGHRPGWDKAIVIEEGTDGEINARDWKVVVELSEPTQETL